MLDASFIDQTHGQTTARTCLAWDPKFSGRRLEAAEANARKPELVETPSADFRDGCNICNF